MVIDHLPEDNALRRQAFGTASLWSVTDHLLALVVDVLQAANWQRQGDNRKPRPKPLARPRPKPRALTVGPDGTPRAQPEPDDGAEVIGRGGGIPIEDMKARLGW